jgi:hypothetical protein
VAKFILHVWTKNAEKRQWVFHVDGHTFIVNDVILKVPTRTRADMGDLDANGNPCAHWYIEGKGHPAITVDGETIYVFEESPDVIDAEFRVISSEGSKLEETGDSPNS